MPALLFVPLLFNFNIRTEIKDGPGKVRGGGDLVNNQGDWGWGESDLTTNIVTPNWSQLTTSGEYLPDN